MSDVSIQIVGNSASFTRISGKLKTSAGYLLQDAGNYILLENTVGNITPLSGGINDVTLPIIGNSASFVHSVGKLKTLSGYLKQLSGGYLTLENTIGNITAVLGGINDVTVSAIGNVATFTRSSGKLKTLSGYLKQLSGGYITLENTVGIILPVLGIVTNNVTANLTGNIISFAQSKGKLKTLSGYLKQLSGSYILLDGIPGNIGNLTPTIGANNDITIQLFGNSALFAQNNSKLKTLSGYLKQLSGSYILLEGTTGNIGNLTPIVGISNNVSANLTGNILSFAQNNSKLKTLSGYLKQLSGGYILLDGIPGNIGNIIPTIVETNPLANVTMQLYGNSMDSTLYNVESSQSIQLTSNIFCAYANSDLNPILPAIVIPDQRFMVISRARNTTVYSQ